MCVQQIVGREPRGRVSHEAFVNQSWRYRAAASTQPLADLTTSGRLDMKKPKSVLGLSLSFGYLLLVLAIIVSSRCQGSQIFCGFTLGTWMAAFPWTYPFLNSEDTTLHYYAMFALSILGIGANVVIVYFCGSAVGKIYKLPR
jgi:hypothetical protein